jgi:UDP-N-acetylmuramyl pentapeptide phosphotransferase/UDP-N-acetylglucosamine-1-phosphate transferase|tara:strand:+ start:615 stop:1643 length:1029 start_codon:yes stop_codon:yes gene_type:complete
MLDIIFLLSTIFVLFVLTNHLSKRNIFIDSDIEKKQAIHKKLIPRSGGLALFFSITLSIFYNYFYHNDNFLYLLPIIILIFSIGIIDDYGVKLKPLTRFVILFVFCFFFLYFSDLKIKTTGLSLIDNLMFKYNLQFLITTICFLILINGSNFIDGINGNLALHYVCLLILILLIFSYNRLGLDILILSTIISFIVFLYFNFKNRIFFGDGGAYLSGFILGIFILEIMYLEIYISPFFYIILTFYLGSEVLISFLRRIIKKENVMIADFNHLHSLLFTILSKKIKLDPHVSTSLIINFVYVILVMPAIFFANNFELTRYYSLFLYFLYFLIFFSINKIAKNLN